MGSSTWKDHPTVWNNLGLALYRQATRTEGPEGLGLLEQAATAYRHALEVRTKKDLPLEWATTRMNLGAVFEASALRIDGEDRKELLTLAEAFIENALSVYTQPDFPNQWSTGTRQLNRIRKALCSEFKECGK
jgi:hypothetical protein